MTRLRLVHTESSCGWGGQELRVLAEAAGMVDRGHEVLIVAPTEASILREAAKRGLPVAALPITRKRLSGAFALRRLLREHAAGIVITHSSTDSWLTALACVGLTGAPFIVRTRHVSAPIADNAPNRWLYGRAAAHVVTTGEALRLQVMKEAHLAPERVTSVPTGIDLDRFSPGDRAVARAALSLPADAFIVGIVATLRSWKGHRYLVDAVAAMQDQHVTLVIVGDGPGRDNLHEQVKALGIEDRVVMPGNQSDVVPWLQAFDVFALPSYANEGVPQALMQAMACGLPVVTTPVGAIGEIVSDGVTGLMVTPRDAGALQQALLRLQGDPALREQLGRAGLAQAHQRFSAARMLDDMERIFATVLAS